jgi:plastocyanin
MNTGGNALSARRALFVAMALGALLLSACGGDDQAKGTDRTTAPTVATTNVRSTQETMPSESMETHFTITAKNIAFTPTKIHAPENQQLEIVFDNEDAGVAHNLHIKTPDEQKTDVKQGVGKDTLTFTVSKAGTYDYVCDVHPTMKGELKVG